MSLTSYRAAPPRVRWFVFSCRFLCGLFCCWFRVGRPGSDLLSRVLRRSTIGAEGFHGRVRDGIGCGALAMTTRSSDRKPVGGWVCCLCEGPPGGGECLRGCARGDCRCARGQDQAARAISTSRLRGSPRFHPWPIDVMVYHGSWGRPGFEGGFPLRCIQRLSRPHLATRRCRWRDNRYTRGAFIPVLSY